MVLVVHHDGCIKATCSLQYFQNEFLISNSDGAVPEETLSGETETLDTTLEEINVNVIIGKQRVFWARSYFSKDELEC